MTARTIYIVDDNNEFRQSTRWWLEGAGYDVVDFADPNTALQSLTAEDTAAAHGDACLLLDVRMPQISGLDLHDRLRASGVGLPIVYMTGHGDVPLAVQAMQKGAVSFLEKPFDEQALEAALERAFEQPDVPATSGAMPLDTNDCAVHAWQDRLAKLTPRERELLQWLMQDKLNKTIADLMGISIKTVELHRKHLMDKLGAQSATHLMRMAVTGRVN
jgi:two-component system, LuxR family, response regulator FixJ